MCAECATDWDGINYCVACLERRRGALRSGRRLPGWLVLGLASGLLLVATARVMVWTAVLLAGLR